MMLVSIIYPTPPCFQHSTNICFLSTALSIFQATIDHGASVFDGIAVLKGYLNGNVFSAVNNKEDILSQGATFNKNDKAASIEAQELELHSLKDFGVFEYNHCPPSHVEYASLIQSGVISANVSQLMNSSNSRCIYVQTAQNKPMALTTWKPMPPSSHGALYGLFWFLLLSSV